MVFKIRRPALSRRHVLRGLGGAAIGLPLLDAMRSPSRARAAGTDCPQRLIIMYSPNGTIADSFWPSQVNSETDFQLSPILSPLEQHKQDLLIVGGVDYLSAVAANENDSSPGDAHQKGTGHCLTATALLPGNFTGDGGLSAGWAGGISVDQEVANAIGQGTPFPSLELGVAVQGASVRSRISYRAAGQPLPPQNSPYAAYARLFGDSLGDPAEIAKRTSRRHAVLDTVADDYTQLRSKLGGEDRDKLDNHLSGINAIRQRLDSSVITFEGSCQPLDQGEPIDVNDVSNMPLVGGLQMDLIANAFACDLTRVATLMWSNSTAGHVLSFVDPEIKEGHHTIAHKGDQDTVKIAQNVKINTWYASQMAGMIERLKAMPEGDGTVFDNTMIVWVNEQNRGNNHDRRDVPYVIAGSAGGALNTGRYLNFDGDIGHNRMLVSILNAMGVDTDTFGDPQFGTGPLSGLT